MPVVFFSSSHVLYPQNPQFNPAGFDLTPINITVREAAIEIASRAMLGLSFALARSSILAISFFLVGSSSIDIISMLSIPLVFGAVLAAPAAIAATSEITCFSRSSHFFICASLNLRANLILKQR